jgi:hypothetical protein
MRERTMEDGEDGPPPLLIKHRRAQQILDCGPSFYWGLVRAGQITVVGRGKAGRADYASIRSYVRSLLAEARAEKAEASMNKESI